MQANPATGTSATPLLRRAHREGVNPPPGDTVMKNSRAFARLVTGSRASGDRLVSMAMDYMAISPCRMGSRTITFGALLDAMRTLLRLQAGPAMTGAEALPMKSHLQLPLDVREAAALHLALGLEVEEIAALLDRAPDCIQLQINQSWGTHMMLLASCPQH